MKDELAEFRLDAMDADAEKGVYDSGWWGVLESWLARRKREKDIPVISEIKDRAGNIYTKEIRWKDGGYLVVRPDNPEEVDKLFNELAKEKEEKK